MAEAYCPRGDLADLELEFDERLGHCPLCDSREIVNDDHDEQGRQVDRCRNCSLLFMNPQYTDHYLDRYYANYGQCGAGTLEIPNPNNLSERRVAAKADALRFVERHTKPGRFLSIGCYDGIELLLAQRNGWTTEGYDVDASTMELLRQQVDMPIYSGDFFDLALPANEYDCVYMDQVLEHPKNPQDYLREIHRILRPGGLLYIGCPNMGSISNQFKTVFGKLGLKGRRGKHYGMFHHLFFYDPKSLGRTLAKHFGYEVVATQGDPIIGLKSFAITENWHTRLSSWIRREVPLLESSFRMLVRKPVSRHHSVPLSRAA